jgi:hypothetical protein
LLLPLCRRRGGFYIDSSTFAPQNVSAPTISGWGSLTGFGNLIIGYDQPPTPQLASLPARAEVRATPPATPGGATNTAGGKSTVVIGGGGVTDNDDFSIAPQPPFQ